MVLGFHGGWLQFLVIKASQPELSKIEIAMFGNNDDNESSEWQSR